VPFGIAQIGKAFRNEITPGNFIFRTREFEQMEMQFFVEPGTDEKWMEHWMEKRLEWITGLGINPEKVRFHPHGPKDLAHYAKAAYDIEYEFPFGWQEFEGIHNRTDFDLNRHQEYSGKNLLYVDPNDRDKKYIPYVIETSAGADRTTLVVLADAYREETVLGESEGRVVLGLHPKLAPIKAAVLPLVKKDGLPERAHAIHDALRKQGLLAFYDEAGSIGKRYRRQDEAGTPFCITVDGEDTDTVTVRYRDTLQQERISSDAVVGFVSERVR
jgi:glycyl-tRNA synthetase